MEDSRISIRRPLEWFRWDVLASFERVGAAIGRELGLQPQFKDAGLSVLAKPSAEIHNLSVPHKESRSAHDSSCPQTPTQLTQFLHKRN